MKKNNKFRNNGGNSNAYSLNYKFDSISPAGKVSGTALDLIKKYNELAKEAHGSGDYVEMEIYRQYAEHYRKIVTEINERKNFRNENTAVAAQEGNSPQVAVENNAVQNSENENKTQDATSVESVVENQLSKPNNQLEQKPKTASKKVFKVIEIKSQNNDNNQENPSRNEAKVKRGTRRKKVSETNAAETNAAAV